MMPWRTTDVGASARCRYGRAVCAMRSSPRTGCTRSRSSMRRRAIAWWAPCGSFSSRAESPAGVLARLAHRDTKLVTATITEKGYCLRADGTLDFSHPDIQNDVRHPGSPMSFVGYVTEGLRLRREQNLPPPNIVSCDNLTGNGAKLRRAVVDLARQRDAGLAAWVENEVAFPSTMIDSITPATDDALRARVAGDLGVIDRWPVQREFFTQWVVEDVTRGEVPDWRAIGVTVTSDVEQFEQAKLRLLNGAHSTLAYLGSLAGHETVAQAMHDAALSGFVTQLMTEDIAPTLAAPNAHRLHRHDPEALPQSIDPAPVVADRLGRIAEATVSIARHDRRCACCRTSHRAVVRADRGMVSLPATQGAQGRARQRPTRRTPV